MTTPFPNDRRLLLSEAEAMSRHRGCVVDQLATSSIHTDELTISVGSFVTGWQAGLARPPKINSSPTSLQFPRIGAVSLAAKDRPLKVTSYKFPEAVWHAASPPTAVTDSSYGPRDTAIEDSRAASAADPTLRNAKLTRLRPPHDVVKLDDRLYYLLQPAIETVVSSGELAFPFRPFPFQFEGVAFLYPRAAAVLADEMGLGKTMQAITALRLLLHAGEVRRILLVCPKPLVTNWARELRQWAPEIPAVVIEGDQAKRRWQWRLDEAPLKIANYELLHRDAEALSDAGIVYDLVILDEAQRIKNRSGSTSQIVRSIPRRRGWALTGTPIENGTQDLVGIFEFLSPGYLRPDMKPRRMGKATADYILRRTKDQVLTDLPPKTIRDSELELSPEQRHSYQLAEEEGVLRLTEMGDSATIQHVFELVLRLKQICNFDPATGESAKYERLEADLDEIAASGRKAIIFSQWVSTLETLAGRLSRFTPLQYHGQVPTTKRDDVIRQFREERDRQVLLISYGAGGVGLNLQFAEYVFLFDRWWNPALEDQAINRAHRIGAAGPVTVTRFLTIGTIEQRIDQILRDKREIFDTVFSDLEPRRNTGLSQQEIFGLFQLRYATGENRAAA